MPTTLLRNATILDGRTDEPLPDHHVLVEDGIICEVSERPLQAPPPAPSTSPAAPSCPS